MGKVKRLFKKIGRGFKKAGKGVKKGVTYLPGKAKKAYQSRKETSAGRPSWRERRSWRKAEKKYKKSKEGPGLFGKMKERIGSYREGKKRKEVKDFERAKKSLDDIRERHKKVQEALRGTGKIRKAKPGETSGPFGYHVEKGYLGKKLGRERKKLDKEFAKLGAKFEEKRKWLDAKKKYNRKKMLKHAKKEGLLDKGGELDVLKYMGKTKWLSEAEKLKTHKYAKKMGEAVRQRMKEQDKWTAEKTDAWGRYKTKRRGLTREFAEKSAKSRGAYKGLLSEKGGEMGSALDDLKSSGFWGKMRARRLARKKAKGLHKKGKEVFENDYELGHWEEDQEMVKGYVKDLGGYLGRHGKVSRAFGTASEGVSKGFGEVKEAYQTWRAEKALGKYGQEILADYKETLMENPKSAHLQDSIERVLLSKGRKGEKVLKKMEKSKAYSDVLASGLYKGAQAVKETLQIGDKYGTAKAAYAKAAS